MPSSRQAGQTPPESHTTKSAGAALRRARTSCARAERVAHLNLGRSSQINHYYGSSEANLKSLWGELPVFRGEVLWTDAVSRRYQTIPAARSKRPRGLH